MEVQLAFPNETFAVDSENSNYEFIEKDELKHFTKNLVHLAIFRQKKKTNKIFNDPKTIQ